MPDHELSLLEALKAIGTKTPDSALSGPVTRASSEEHPTATAAVSPPPASVAASNIWRHPDAHPIALDMALVKKYGSDWLGWEAETWRVRIPADFKTQAVSELTISKLQACRALHLVDSFWQRWEVFIACLMPFNGEFPDFRIMPVPTVAQCLVACDTAAYIRTDVLWSEEMKAYFASVYHHDGIYLPLAPLDFVHLEVPASIDQNDLARRWTAAQASGKVPAEDDVMSEQVRRLFVAKGYLDESRARLQQQVKFYA